MTEATAIRVRRRVLGERSFGVFIVSNRAFPPGGQEEAQCRPKGLSMVMELTMGYITCCWGNEIEAVARPRSLTKAKCVFMKGERCRIEGRNMEQNVMPRRRTTIIVHDHMTVHLNLSFRPVK